jgi:general stress protein YciG
MTTNNRGSNIEKAQEARHNKSHEEESAIAKKALETRAREAGKSPSEVMSELGQKGGSSSHRGSNKEDNR